MKCRNLPHRILIALLPLFLSVRAQAQLPVFPGADGAAKYISGGRTGVVYHVTVLDKNYSDNRPGTLRYGLDDNNFTGFKNRTIVFDIGGVFWLGKYGGIDDNGWDSSNSRYNWPANVTVAGQTAPGPVYIMGGTTKPSKTNIVIRNISFAPGYGLSHFYDPGTNGTPKPGTFPDTFAYDAMDISGQNIMIDHISTFYCTDEAISANELANNITVENCDISQGQNFPQKDAESGPTSYTGHALAHLWQPGTGAKSSIINNLYAHEAGRLPRVGSEVGTGAYNDFRNNLFYNWQSTAGGNGGSSQPSFNNFINNFYLAGYGGDGPVGGANSNVVHFAGGTGIFSSSSVTRAFVNGNLKDTDKNNSPNNTSSADTSYGSVAMQPVAYDVSIGATLTAKNAFTNILTHAGARWWERTYNFKNNSGAVSSIDERLIKEAITGTGQIIAWADDPFNLTTNALDGVEWRALLAWRADTNTGAAPFNRPAGWDTDGDGMPDYWEIEHGLNPNDPSDGNGDFDHDGYSNLEEYLNEIAAWPAPDNIYFNGTNTTRYAEIYNWQVNGANVTVTNLGLGTTTTYTTYTLWQPSKYDTAVISNSTVLVDSVGQHAGTLRLAPAAANNASLNITNGWLKVANTLEIAKAGTGTLNLSGGKLRVGTLTNGAGTATFNFTGGTLSADTVTFDVVNNGGTISPGDSPGSTHALGNLTQASGTTQIEISGTNSGDFDTVVVDGTATLGGTLDVKLLNGFQPPIGAVFTVLTCGARSGTFAAFTYPSNTTMELVYTSTSVQIQVVNSAPVFPAVGDQVVNELSPFSLSVVAADYDLPAQTWTYSLTNSPAGASVDSNGLVTWTPGEADGPMVTNITVLATDDGTPSATGARTFQITVNEVNTAPSLASISDQVVNEQTLLSVNAVASDDDLPPQNLTYSLINSPPGASVDSSGLITWTPTEADGPMVTNITVQVADNSTPNLTASRTFQVTVNEVNSPPTLAAITGRTINAGVTLNVTNVFGDSDLPANSLTFSLLAAPSGASIDGNGVFTWRPAVAQANTTNLVTVQLADDGTPNLTTNQSFQVVVNPLGPVTITPVVRTNGQFLMRIQGDVGPDYTVLASQTLTNWNMLSTTNPAATPFDYLDGSGLSNRFYRILLGP